MDLFHYTNSSLHLKRTTHGKPYLAVSEAPHREKDLPNWSYAESVRAVPRLFVSPLFLCEEL